MPASKTSKVDFPGEAHTQKEIVERLEHYRELLLEAKAGMTTVTLREVRAGLDHWLDEFCAEQEIRSFGERMSG